MKRKCFYIMGLVAVLAIAFSICTYAAIVDSGDQNLNSSIGYISIMGELHTTTGTLPYKAVTKSDQAISSQGVTKLTARVTFATAVSTTTVGDNDVVAYGTGSGSTHYAYSSIDDVYFSLAEPVR